MLVQQSFLGASIVSFNANIGWGSSPSNLSVTLVEDPAHFDDFDPPVVGTPVTFNYSGWIFEGVLQSYRYSKSRSGFTYVAQVQDPREILDGVQLILGGQSETTGTIPNLMNIFGYLERNNFGDSQRNELGIPWKKVRDTVVTLSNAATGYGGPIALRNFFYHIDLSQLPNIDENYRVGGSNQMSLMDFIADVCEAGSHDYFITLEQGTIKVKTIARTDNPQPGLASYIASLTNVVSSEAGIEFRNDTTGRYLVGAPVHEMFLSTLSVSDSGTPNNDNIWPFWGFDKDFSLVKGEGINDDHLFTLDCRHLNIKELGEFYYTNVAELRHALDSKESWESYLQSNNGDDSQTYLADASSSSPHIGKFSALKLYGIYNMQGLVGSGIKQYGYNITSIAALNDLSNSNILLSSDTLENENAERSTKVYNFIREYAEGYYGSKWMISIPEVKVYKETDTNIWKVSLEPADGGFLASGVFKNAVATNKLPGDYNRLQLEDGRFPAYVRYDNPELLDMSEIPEGDVIYGSGNTSVFVKCSVTPGVAFEDLGSVSNPNFSKPRAVINMPGPIRQKDVDATDMGSAVNDLLGLYESGNVISSGYRDRIMSALGVDTIWNGQAGLAMIPNLVALPLKDNLNRYGPWHKIGANGKIEYELDDNLAPWNYNGFEILDKVARARVNDGVSNMQQSETGSLEVEGIPSFSIGQQLMSSGPYVTDIDVNIGAQGVTTTYKFATWSPRYSKITRSRLDRLDKLVRSSKDLENQAKGLTDKFVDRNLSATDIDAGYKRYLKRVVKDKHQGGSTSHGIISGEGFINESGNGTDSVTPNCWIQPIYNFTTQIQNDYKYKAGVSIDGLFRPFSTNPEGSGYGLPHFETPGSGAAFPTVWDLNPYSGLHDMSVVVRGSAMPINLATAADSGYFNETDYRPMALRGPVILAGWGYDTNGNPVPNSGLLNSGQAPTKEFYPNYRQRQDLWKVGPLDTQWDDDRKVWQAGGTDAKIVRIVSQSGQAFPIDFRRVYYAEKMTSTFLESGNEVVKCSGTGEYMYVGNFRDNVVLESSVYMVFKMGGKYYLDNQSVFNFIGA